MSQETINIRVIVSRPCLRPPGSIYPVNAEQARIWIEQGLVEEAKEGDPQHGTIVGKPMEFAKPEPADSE